ncbi:DUF481 domain-containing protein [Sphingosinicella ginsenosidimutans]|uniref:DUF481 domain-containing protein n=2 Tax=Allosphingosinicella ginsenosidimutans TaxID=1176539 RepID=A0A5C6TW89_9SPHN|nr:DUF481 domain-containing protein [Sphingosinicella ginsenosidimutans]
MRPMMIVPALALSLALVGTPAAAAEDDQPPTAASVATPPQAADQELPPAVQAMVNDALTSGSDAELAAVVKFARRAYPAQASALDSQVAARAARRAAEARARIAAAGPLENWHGRAEVGATRSTGNVDNFGLYGSLGVTREGLRWTHQVRASANVQETDGVRTQEQLLAAYEPRYKVNDRLSTYGLLQAERNPFLGFDARYSASLGLGYAVLKGQHVTVNLQGGPAFRIEEEVTGENEHGFSGRAALDARLQLRPGVALTQNATAFLDVEGNTFTSATGLEAQLVGRLSARLSYNVQYESKPTDGLTGTDTQSRISLVYGF